MDGCMSLVKLVKKNQNFDRNLIIFPSFVLVATHEELELLQARLVWKSEVDKSANLYGTETINLDMVRCKTGWFFQLIQENVSNIFPLGRLNSQRHYLTLYQGVGFPHRFVRCTPQKFQKLLRVFMCLSLLQPVARGIGKHVSKRLSLTFCNVFFLSSSSSFFLLDFLKYLIFHLFPLL